MAMLIHFLALELALAAGGLCLAWRRGDRSPVWTLTAALAAAFLYAAAALAQAPLWPALNGAGRGVAIGTTLAVVGMWLAVALAERPSRVKSIISGKSSARRTLTELAAGGQILATACVAGMLAHWMGIRDGFRPVPERWMALALDLGLLSGAGLIAVSVHGTLINGSVPERIDESLRQLRLASYKLELVTVARALAIVLSLMIGAAFNPFGEHFFYTRLLRASADWLPLRLLLGLLLPMFYGLLVLLAIRERSPKAASAHFLPALVLVLLGELVGACLTIGLAQAVF